jgi:predicted transcriptional regulator
MNIKRIQKSGNYSIISNEILKKKDLSLKSKGLLTLILSLPDKWELSVNGLVAIVKESKNTVYSILKELNGFGYVERKRITDNSGKVIKWELIVYEKPLTKKPDTKKPDVEKCTQVITNSKVITKLNKHNKESFSILVFESGILQKEDSNSFIDYWTESNAKNKMRWQMEKTWDLNLRIKRWKRTTKYGNTKSTQSKIHQQLSSHEEAKQLLKNM